jgi:hypothetical protein
MAELPLTPLHPDISGNVTAVSNAPVTFRSGLNTNIAAVEDKAQLAVCAIEKLQAALGNGALSGGDFHAGTGLSVHAAALTALVGTWVGFDAEQTIGGLTDDDTNYIFLRQDGTWTVNLTGADPADTATHGAFLLWGTATAASGSVSAVTNQRNTFMNLGAKNLTTTGYITSDNFAKTAHYTGFPNRADTALSWVDGASGVTRTLTLTVASTASVWINGVSYSISTLTKQIPDVSGFYWFWITAPGGIPQLNASTDAPAIGNAGTTSGYDQCLVANVYWNTVSDKGILSDERHWMGRDCWNHEYLHETVGARWYTGGTITPTDTTFSISECEMYDEDIEHTLATATKCRVMYHNGSALWEWDDNSATPYKLNGNKMRYNNGTALADCANPNHLCMWIYATNHATYPFMSVMGAAVDNTVAAARLQAPPSLTGIPSAELKLLYRLIFKQETSSVTYVEAADYRTSASIASTYTPTDHSVLTKLGMSVSGHTWDAAVDMGAQNLTTTGVVSGGQVVVGGTATETAGAIKYSSNHFYGWNGSTWLQLDNAP